MALLWTAALCAALLSHRAPAPQTSVKNPAVQISLLHEEAPPVPPPVVPPPRPRPVVHRRAAAQPMVPSPIQNVAVVEDQPPTAALTMAEPDPPAHTEAVSAASIEAQYAATLRTNIDSRTTVPSTPEYRLLKPQGETRVSFTLERDGTTEQVSLAHGSGSHILDRQALSIVQTGRYPPFPERAFPGEARHIFIVTIEFHT
jgi:protein TonB